MSGISLGALAVLLSLVLPPMLVGQGFQQAPPKNLQVLPKDLSRQEVTARMRVIAGSLGVRCEYCHVSTTSPDGREQNDFAADDKDTKKTAREMMRMVNDINDNYLIGDMARILTERHRVTCETCHHGLAKPRTIQAELADAVEANGVDSAVTLYRALRTKYYGRSSYDFGELPITMVAPQIAQMPDQRAAAIALLKLNLEFYPQSVPTFQALAQQSIQAKDTAAAIDALTKAIAIDPNNQQLKRMLGAIRDTTRRPPER